MKRSIPCARPVLAVAALVPLLMLMPTPAPARAASWLDGPISNWNRAGMAIPKAPEPEFAPPPGLCPPVEPLAATATAEERQVAAAGWQRVSLEARGWDIVLVYAQQSVDGMCRPMQFQYFVFTEGKLAGTVSPDPMSSRTDGVGFVSALRRDGVDVEYSRYTPQDPLCCPSGEASVRFTLDRSEAGPVLLPERR